jgi:hypothetical protein
MARETTDPPASERSQAALSQGHGQGSEATSGERVGPIAIERVRKDDGRALILYRSVDDRQP